MTFIGRNTIYINLAVLSSMMLNLAFVGLAAAIEPNYTQKHRDTIIQKYYQYSGMYNNLLPGDLQKMSPVASRSHVQSMVERLSTLPKCLKDFNCFSILPYLPSFL